MKTTLFYVYIVKCFDGLYYTGVTNNLERRIAEHNEGINPESYTFKRRPVELKYFITFNDPLIAFNYEKKIKDWSRKKKEALIKGEYKNLIELSKSKSISRQARTDRG